MESCRGCWYWMIHGNQAEGIGLVFMLSIAGLGIGFIGWVIPKVPSLPSPTTISYVTTFTSTNCFYNATVGTIDNTADWKICGTSITIQPNTKAWLVPTSNGFDFTAGNLQGGLTASFDTWITTNVSSSDVQRTVKYPTDEFAAIIGKTHIDIGFPISTGAQLTYWTGSKPGQQTVNFKLLVRVEGNAVPSPTV